MPSSKINQNNFTPTLKEVVVEAQASNQLIKTTISPHVIDKNNPHNVTAAQTGADPAGSAAAALEQAQADIQNLSEGFETVFTQLATGLYQGDWEIGSAEPMPSIRDIAADEVNKGEEIANGIRTDLTTLQGTVSSHTGDSTIHFTPAERTKLANIEAEANKYIHPDSSVSAGTYRAVTVDEKGHVTAGTNPTTLAEYGIIDAEAKGTTATHNVAVDAHNDIRLLITNLANKLNAFLDVDDETLDQVSEIIKLVNDNVTTLEGILATKVNIADIVNNLTTNVSDKPLSAAQGVALKTITEGIQNELNTHEANVSNPHAVTAEQVGLGKVNNTTDMEKPVSTAQQTAIDAAAAIGTGAQSSIDTHAANKSNPHGVTAEQVGLGNVDNTADADKSVNHATTAGTLSGLTATVAELNVLDGITATTAELNYVDGVTSNIQTQLNGKAPSTHTHAAGDITSGTLGVARGGTGATTFTSGAALIGAGTGAVTTRAITNNTSATSAITGSTNLVTMNTLKNAMNRATAPSAADTAYTTAMVRAIKASTTDLTAGSSALTSGTIYIVYE